MISREKIMKELRVFNQKNGIAFFSKKEAIEYYRELVDMIMDLFKNNQ